MKTGARIRAKVKKRRFFRKHALHARLVRAQKQSAFAQFTTAELKCYNDSVWIINDKRRKFVIRTSFDWKH